MPILIIEDDPDSRDLLRSVLGRLVKHPCIFAKNLVEARECLEREKPDLIIMDLMLEGELGVSLIDLAHQKYNRVPVIITSAYYHYKTALEGHKYDRFFMKPYSVSELAETIKSYSSKIE